MDVVSERAQTRRYLNRQVLVELKLQRMSGMDVRNGRYRQIFFRRRRRERDRGLHIFRLQARESRQHFSSRIATGKTRKDGPERDTGPLKYGLSAANLAIACDALLKPVAMASRCAHASTPA
jgi:hypothetical protein